MFNFGAGRARLITAGGGASLELGVVQSANLDLKVDLKELRGPYRYPIAVADGKGTASGKVQFAQLWPATLAGILGGTQAANAPQAAIGEKHTIGASVLTVALTNAATLVANSEIVVVNIGGDSVFYARGTAGTEAAATALAPTTGVYSIAAGTLTFAAGDAGRDVQITYLYTPAASGNVSVSLAQVGMNTAATFQLTLIGNGKNIYNNAAQQFIVNLNACIAPSLRFDFKLDDFTMMDLDFSAFVDANGTLGSFYLVNPD